MNTNFPVKKNFDIEEAPFFKEIDLKIIFQTLKRKRDLIIKSTFLGLLLGGVFTIIERPTWKGEFQIVLESNSDKSKLGGVLGQFQRNIPNIGGAASLLGDKTDQLQTEVEILKSPSVLINVFEFIKEEKNNKTYNSLRFESWRDKYLSVELTKKTSILNLSYKDKDKDLIIPVLNQISNKYQNYSDKRRIRDIELGLSYFEDQIEIYKKKSEKSNAVAQQFALDQDLTYISMFDSSDGNNLMGNISKRPKTLGVETERIQAVNDLKVISKQLDDLKAMDPELNDVIGFASSLEAVQNNNLLKALSEIDLRLSDLRVYYEENDSSINEILEKKKVLKKALKTNLISTLEGLKIQAEARLKAAERPSEVLIEYSQLVSEAERDKKILDNLENNYRNTQLEKARTRDPWELITKPTILPKPVSPKKLMNILIGLSLGLGSGITASLISDKKEDTLYSTDQIDYLLDLPFLADLEIKNKEKLEESIYLLAKGVGANLKSICFITAEKMDKGIFEIINPLLEKAFGVENYTLTNNPIDAIKYQNIIFIVLIGKTKKKDLYQLKKKLDYQKCLKTGYLALRDGL